jgi:Zn-dependent oligopeptidase
MALIEFELPPDLPPAVLDLPEMPEQFEPEPSDLAAFTEQEMSEAAAEEQKIETAAQPISVTVEEMIANLGACLRQLQEAAAQIPGIIAAHPTAQIAAAEAEIAAAAPDLAGIESIAGGITIQP